MAALLAALAMLGPFSIDMYLPAFHAIGDEFDVPQIAVQQTLSLYLFAYAFMMLWHGALSDALGRRPVVLGGLAIFVLGIARLRNRGQHRVAVAVPHAAGTVRGRGSRRRSRDHPRSVRGCRSAAPDVADHAGLRHRACAGARDRRRAAEHARLARDLLADAGVRARASSSGLRAACPRRCAPAQRQPLHPRTLWNNYRAVLLRVDFLLLAAIPALNFAAFFIYIASAPVFLARSASRRGASRGCSCR